MAENPIKGNRGFRPGVSGNPGGRPSVAKAIKAAGFDPDELRAEVIRWYVDGMRTLDRETPSARFCVQQLDWRLNGKPREIVEIPVTDERVGVSLEEVVATLDEQGLRAFETLLAQLDRAGVRLLPDVGSDTEH